MAGNQGTIGKSANGGKTWTFSPIPGFEKSDFRTLYAFDSLNAVVANAGSPAFILRTENGGRTWAEVYRNSHPDAFLDGVDFWDEKRGIMYGDPIGGRMLLIKTTDGGRTWLELPENERPSLDSGEASFAASGTNIRVWGKKSVAVATGGVKSRIWFSEDEGKSWSKISVPILQGKDSQGIFSFIVHDKNWIVVGGDFKSDTLRKNHVFVSIDQGKTWTFPSKPTGGYRECVEFLGERSFISAGPGGVDLSRDGGNTWNSISSQKGFHVVRRARKGKLTMLAGGKGSMGIFD